MLHEMISRGIAPKAILFNSVNPILAQGAALADMAMCDRFEDGDVTRLIQTGDQVTVDPQSGLVTVRRA
jgi:predicted aconitase with swiveling domain